MSIYIQTVYMITIEKPCFDYPIDTTITKDDILSSVYDVIRPLITQIGRQMTEYSHSTMI